MSTLAKILKENSFDQAVDLILDVCEPKDTKDRKRIKDEAKVFEKPLQKVMTMQRNLFLCVLITRWFMQIDLKKLNKRYSFNWNDFIYVNQIKDKKHFIISPTARHVTSFLPVGYLDASNNTATALPILLEGASFSYAKKFDQSTYDKYFKIQQDMFFHDFTAYKFREVLKTTTTVSGSVDSVLATTALALGVTIGDFYNDNSRNEFDTKLIISFWNVLLSVYFGDSMKGNITMKNTVNLKYKVEIYSNNYTFDLVAKQKEHFLMGYPHVVKFTKDSNGQMTYESVSGSCVPYKNKSSGFKEEGLDEVYMFSACNKGGAAAAVPTNSNVSVFGIISALQELEPEVSL